MRDANDSNKCTTRPQVANYNLRTRTAPRQDSENKSCSIIHINEKKFIICQVFPVTESKKQSCVSELITTEYYVVIQIVIEIDFTYFSFTKIIFISTSLIMQNSLLKHAKNKNELVNVKRIFFSCNKTVEKMS